MIDDLEVRVSSSASRQYLPLAQLLTLTLGLAKSPLANTLMHASVLINNDSVVGTSDCKHGPVHNSVAPVRGTSVGNILSTTAASDPAQSSPDKHFRVWNSHAGALDLGHGRGDEV